MAAVEDRVEYWMNKWEKNEAPWHHPKVNEFLLRHFAELVPSASSSSPKRIFVPLCGKTLDLKWLYDQGLEVVGVDAAEKPILEFFAEQNLPYEERDNPESGHYFTTPDGRLKIYVSDLFAMTPRLVGTFDCVWDRGSVIAIYHQDRVGYAALMKQLLNQDFRYLIDSMVYDQSKFSGPPRSLPVDEIITLFGDFADVRVLEDVDRNKDENPERTPRARWNLDECHEIVVLLSPKH